MADMRKMTYTLAKKKNEEASGDVSARPAPGQRQQPSGKGREVGAEATSRGTSGSPLPKRSGSGVVIPERSSSRPDSKKRPRAEYSGKGKAAEVSPPSKEFMEATKVSRDPKLALVPAEQLSLDLRTAVTTAESYILSAPSFLAKAQTHCVELEQRYIDARSELESLRVEAEQRRKADTAEIDRLSKELEVEKSRREAAAKDVARYKQERREAGEKLQDLLDRVGPQGEKAVEAFKSSMAAAEWLATEGGAMVRYAELEHYFRGQVAARERAKTFFPATKNDYMEILEAPPPDFWEIPDLPADLTSQAKDVIKFVQEGMDQVGD